MNILLYQPATIAEEDQIYLNGKLLPDSLERTEMYDRIVSIFKTVKSKYPLVCKTNGLFVVRGLFDAVDEKGRKLSFIFMSDSKEFLEEILSVTKTVGYEVAPSTITYIQKFKHACKIKTYLVVILLAITFLATITILCK